MLQHWAVRDAYIHKRAIPSNFDWSSPAEMCPANASPAGGAIAERHHALNWLICYGDADWDDVDTPT
jgi:hypothetical protein